MLDQITKSPPAPAAAVMVTHVEEAMTEKGSTEMALKCSRALHYPIAMRALIFNGLD